MSPQLDDMWDDDPFEDNPRDYVAAQPSVPTRSTPSGEAPMAESDIEDDEELARELLPPGREHFVIEDAASASWVIRKIVEARARQERIKDWAKMELRDAKREEEFFLRRFSDELQAWAQENSGGRKTLRLPDGTIGFRHKRPTIQIEDEEQVLQWCEEHLPEAVKTRRSVLKTPLNEHLKETGEIPPGCDLDAGGDEFYVR